jgi:hypothetical protein
MRRQRRNTAPLELRAPAPPPDKPEVVSLAGLTVIGLVANPKTHEPALVVTDGTYVSLRSLSAADPLRRLGRGYYEEHSNEPSQITGLPRSHTPDGVLIKRKGWGTALYTALALGAHQCDQELVEIEMFRSGGGICSWTDNRSAEADKWWDAAVKLGLADQQVEEETEKDEDVDLNLSPSDLDRFVDEGEVVYVNSVSVDIEKTIEKTVELYKYTEASRRRHLAYVAMSVEVPKGISVPASLEFLWRAVRDDSDLVTEADPVGLLALDVRSLDRSAIHLLSLCFGEAGLDNAACDEMYLRYERGLDPGMASGQGRLFKANAGGLSDVEAAREAAGWADLEDLP